MFVLIALVLSCSAGIAAHFALPGREYRGNALSAAIATVATGVIYTGFQWAGLAESSVVLWLASVGGGILIGVIATVWLTRSRAHRDAARARALGIALG